jgi:Spy/CpxP family protein refolding chaperone
MKAIRVFNGAASMIAFLVFATVAFGQPHPPKPPSPAERAEQLKKDLGLTDVQTTKIKLLFEEQEKEMRKSFGPPPDGAMDEPPGEPPGDPREMRAGMMQHEKELTAKIGALLTPAQKKKFDAVEKERRKRFSRPPGLGE